MPDLPILTVSQAHFDRLVAAFPGATNAERADAYKKWLTNRLIERVRMVEARRIDREAYETKQAELIAVDASLPATVPEPGMPGDPVFNPLP